MLITLNWLSEFLELEEKNNKFAISLAEELLLSGLETEVLEINKLGKYSILKVNSINTDPIPENTVIKIDVTNIISKLLFLVNSI